MKEKYRMANSDAVSEWVMWGIRLSSANHQCQLLLGSTLLLVAMKLIESGLCCE